MYVSEIERATGGHTTYLVLQHYRQVPVATPLRRDQWIGIENAAVTEVLLQPFVDREIGRDHDKVAGHR